MDDRLIEALRDADPTGGLLLGALALRDPLAAARLALDLPEAVTGLPEAERGRLVDLLLTAAGTEPGLLGELLERFGPALSPAAAAALIERLDPAARPAKLVDLVRKHGAGRGRTAATVRALTKLAREAGDDAGAHRLLTELGQLDPSLGTVASILRTRKDLAPDGGQPVRIAVLSSYTIDQVVPYLDLECRAIGLSPEIYLAPFNTWAREVLDPGAQLRRFEPDLAFLSVSIDDLIPELAGSPPEADLIDLGAQAIDRIVTAARHFTEWAAKPLVVHTLHSAQRGPLGTMEGREGPGRAGWLAGLNDQLGAALRTLPRTYLVDVTDVLLRSGAGPDNPKLRHLAGMRIPPAAMPELARSYVRFVAPQKGLTRKCVVLDLDNTLWGGVVGEDGPHGIKLGMTSPGSEYVEFQRFLATLPQRGLLLAVCSKNNPDDALEVIRGHESMVLREDAFSAVRINWRPKPENLASIAEELNIGIDSLVFIDDNPDERELMRQLLPQVLTVEMPRDPSLYRSTVEALPQIQTLAVTAEDRLRVGQYRANRQREVQRVSAGSVDDYLKSLEVTVAIAPISEALLPRVAQLFQKTNQFNVTTRRYDAADLGRFAAPDSGWRCYTLKAGDRFGDHGLVAVALTRTGSEAWTVDSFLMSCRVIGYGIETALMATIAADAVAGGATRLDGEFIVTKKNVPARDIYERHGFSRAETVDGLERWERSLSDGGVAFPAWINRTTP